MNKKIHVVTDWVCSLAAIGAGIALIPNWGALLLFTLIGVALNPMFRDYAAK